MSRLEELVEGVPEKVREAKGDTLEKQGYGVSFRRRGGLCGQDVFLTPAWLVSGENLF